jgi:hypothetical protein
VRERRRSPPKNERKKRSHFFNLQLVIVMRRLVLLLGSVLGANAFTSPGPIAVQIEPQSRFGVIAKLSSSNENNDNKNDDIVINDLQRKARIVVLATFAAATIATVPFISAVDNELFVANAAVSPPSTTIFSPGVYYRRNLLHPQSSPIP